MLVNLSILALHNFELILGFLDVSNLCVIPISDEFYNEVGDGRFRGLPLKFETPIGRGKKFYLIRRVQICRSYGHGWQAFLEIG